MRDAPRLLPAYARRCRTSTSIRPWKPSPGRTLTVPAGGDFEAMLDEAQPGDEIVLTAGARYKGPLPCRTRKRVRAGSPSVRWDRKRLSSAGNTFQPSQAGRMAALVSNQHGVILAEPRAHHYRFIGIEIKPEDNTLLRDLVLLGTILPGLSTTCLTTSFSTAATYTVRRKERAAACDERPAPGGR